MGELAALEGRGCGGNEVGEQDADYHCEENEEEEEAVEERKGFKGGGFAGGGGGLLFGVRRRARGS